MQPCNIRRNRENALARTEFRQRLDEQIAQLVRGEIGIGVAHGTKEAHPIIFAPG
jgi:hypothetical protein